MPLDNDTAIMGSNVQFEQTQWNLVQAARDLKSLEALIHIYWKPLYFFVRQHGYDNETAKDVTQEFLMALLERDAFTRADPARGRFRTFLLSSLSNFLKDWRKSERAQKRGGGNPILSLDFQRGEDEFTRQVSSGDPPETVLNRAWARSLWEKAMTQMAGDPAHLEAFRLYLVDTPYDVISAHTGLSESAAKTAVHRLKLQLRDIVVGHIRQTCASEEDVKAEVAEFLALLS